MPKHKVTWILIADGSRAKIVTERRSLPASTLLPKYNPPSRTSRRI